MNGMILGLGRQEIRRREEEIISFSEIGDFIDAPVRTYSSGMYVRLAFSVAVNVDPEVLIIDEVLTVGDAHFQHKCKAKLDEFKRRLAIILVTHDLGTVESWCTRALWLDKAKVSAMGEPRAVVGAYRQSVMEAEKAETNAVQQPAPASRANEEVEVRPPAPHPAPESAAERWGNRQVEIVDVVVRDRAGKEQLALTAGEPFSVDIHYRAKQPTDRVVIGVSFRSADGQWLFGTSTRAEGQSLPTLTGSGHVRCGFPLNAVVGRQIRLDVGISNEDDEPFDFWTGCRHLDSLSPVGGRLGLVHMDMSWVFDPTIPAVRAANE
jgi:ABC-type glutathione transport system ATPase component